MTNTTRTKLKTVAGVQRGNVKERKRLAGIQRGTNRKE